jgi:hypothetical protein
MKARSEVLPDPNKQRRKLFEERSRRVEGPDAGIKRLHAHHATWLEDAADLLEDV